VIHACTAISITLVACEITAALFKTVGSTCDQLTFGTKSTPVLPSRQQIGRTMTPEEKFIQLNIKGCTWESLRVVDRDELTRILKESNVVMSFSLLEICTILELWRLRQLETSALLCKQVGSPWLYDRLFCLF
jgi:hypothetical protein